MTIHFGLLELDLLTAFARTPLPFPLRVPSFGRIANEREALLSAAGDSLAERGLATAEEPVGVAADLVTALRGYHSSVDLVLTRQETVTAVAAMLLGDHAVVCCQPIGGPPSPVAVTRTSYDALADALVNLLPVLEAAPGLPIAFPPDAIAELPPVTGRGQLGVVRRAGGKKRPLELSWLDCPDGRVRIDHDDRGWVSLNPLRHNELVHAIREATALARGR